MFTDTKKLIFFTQKVKQNYINRAPDLLQFMWADNHT